MNRQVRFALCVLLGVLAINLDEILVAADVTVITVSANQDVPRNESSYYEQVERKRSSHVQINITDDFHFFVVQIHTFFKNVSISTTQNFDEGSYVAGNDVGLVQFKVPDQINYDFYLDDFMEDVRYVVSVVPYGENDPVPGGCNLVFEVENSPYQRVSYDRKLVKVQVQQASVSNIICEADAVKLDMYYMPFIDPHTAENHFMAIRKMATVKDIELNGIKVADALAPPTLLRSYVNYIGTGRVFGVVARWKNYSSAYIPTVSYGCDISREDSCHKDKAVPGVLAVLYFMVSFAVFMERRKTTGFLCAIICAVHFTVAIDYIDSMYLLVTLSMLALMLALSAWYYFDKNKFNAAIISYFIGCFFTSIFTGFSNISQVTINYWSVHLTVSILCFLGLVWGKYEMNRVYLVTLGWALGYSLMLGGYLNYYITNSLLYFTIHYYQPIVVDVINIPLDLALIISSFISYYVLKCAVSCIYGRIEENTERTPLIQSTTVIILERDA